MTVNYTTNLALGQPVTGTESGTWGDDVNNSVTSYLDIAIAGGLSVTVTVADVTLVLTQGTSSATNIGSTTAQYAILNVSGAMTAARNLILPSSSRVYVINNNTTGGYALTVKGSATSGVTMVNGEKAQVFWTGSDYAKVGSTAGAATFTSITNTGLTSGRVVYSTTGGLETDSAGLTFDGTNFATTGTASAAKLIPTGSSATGNGLYLPAANALGLSTNGTNAVYIDSSQKIGFGVSTIATNFRTQFLGTAGSNTSAASSGTTQSASAVLRLQAGGGFTATLDIGQGGGTGSWLQSCDTADLSTNYPLLLNPNGGNVGIGTNSPTYKLDVRGDAVFGAGSGASLLRVNGGNSGAGAGSAIAFGGAGAYPLAIGYSSSILGGAYDAAMLLYSGGGSLVLGSAADIIFSNNGRTTEYMRINSSGNVGIGTSSPQVKLQVNSTTNTASNNVAWDTTGASLTVAFTGTSATDAGPSISFNDQGSTGLAAIKGAREATAGNGYLSFLTRNGGGGQYATERARIDSSGNLLVGQTSNPAVGRIAATFEGNTTNGLELKDSTDTAGAGYISFRNAAGTATGSVTRSTGNTVLYNVSSDQRLKENIQDAESASTLIDAIQVRQFDWKTDNSHQRYGFIAQELVTVAPEAVHQPVNEEEMMAVDYSKLVPMLVKEIQSLRKRLADAGIA